MAIRLRAFLMLLIVGLVLPAAGSPHFFCMEAGAFIHQSDCCDCSGGDQPETPCCVTAPKPIPDALNANGLTLPAPFFIVAPTFEMPYLVEIPVVVSIPAWSMDRGPPGDIRLYLLRHSLLL
ncbi:MAG: hypothetical protein WEB53_17235 [Akkermansiaceae bacterium]